MAGVILGIMLVVMFSAYIIINCKVSDKYEAVSFSWTERLVSLRKSFIIILGPIFVLGSIYTGVATPTEAGAILVIYSLFCAFIFRKINWKGFVQCLIDSSILSTMIIMIMVGALVMSNVITLLQVPANLTEYIFSSGLPIWGGGYSPNCYALPLSGDVSGRWIYDGFDCSCHCPHAACSGDRHHCFWCYTDDAH